MKRPTKTAQPYAAVGKYCYRYDICVKGFIRASPRKRKYPARICAAILAVLTTIYCMPTAQADDVIARMYVSDTVTSFLRGREKAEARGDSYLARFYAGDELEVVEDKKGWFRVKGGETGTVWVSAEYVTPIAPDSISQPYVVIGGGRVHLRRTPGGEHVRWVQNGAIVDVFGFDGNWAQVDGGYISADYLQDAQEQKEGA